MDSKGWPPVRAQVLRDIIGNPFGAHENEDLGTFLADLVKVLNQLGPLLKVGADRNNLTDVVVGCQLHRANVHLDEVVQEILQR